MSALTGKVAVVTGGSRGIGFGIAKQFLAGGAAVVITGTHDDTLDIAARDLQGSGRAALMPFRADVRRYEEVDRLMSSTVTRFGGIDVLVNNAGVGAFSPVADMTLDEWDRVIGTNLTGAFHCCKAALPHLRARGGGWIINISSLAGKNPFVDGAAYCASKAALNAFSESLMQEVRHDGIRVAYVLPGSVRTGFMGRSAGDIDPSNDWKLTPEDIAEVVTDLVAHPSRSLPSRVEIRPARPPRKG